MGSVVLSVDAELAWGVRDRDALSRERIKDTREAWSDLVDLFDEFDVPVTWGIVGHLFCESCDGEHADHPAAADGRFESDPGGRSPDDDGWFAPDLIDAVDAANVDHDVGSHTFSHVEMGDEETTREIAVAETKGWLDAAADRGFSFDSLVFPANSVGHRDVLAAYGLKCYRGVEPATWYDGTVLEPLASALRGAVDRVTPPLVEPAVDEHGLVNVPASMYLFDPDGAARSLLERAWGDPVVRRATRGIDRAAEGDGVFHLWFHLDDVTTDRNFERLRTVLSHLEACRERTDLAVETMADVAAEFREDSTTARAPIGPR